MNLEFTPQNRPHWELIDDKIIYEGAIIALETIVQVSISARPALFQEGVIRVERANGSTLELIVTNSQKQYFDTAIEHIKSNSGGERARQKAKALQEKREEERKRDEEIRSAEKIRIAEEIRTNANATNSKEAYYDYDIHGVNPLYEIQGNRGRRIYVYEHKCVIKVDVTLGSIITHNATDGEKTIYYKDVIGVQLKKDGLLIGYLQLETASEKGNNKSDNFYDENTFTFDKYEDVYPAYKYIISRLDEIKRI